MPAKFKEIERNRGVDSLKPGPGWIMVPQGKSNIVCLTGAAGYGLPKAVEGKDYVKIDVISEDKYSDAIGRTNALSIGKDDKLLRITGLIQGPGRSSPPRAATRPNSSFRCMANGRSISHSFSFTTSTAKTFPRRGRGSRRRTPMAGSHS
jgi:hypothetical protein